MTDFSIRTENRDLDTTITPLNDNARDWLNKNHVAHWLPSRDAIIVKISWVKNIKEDMKRLGFTWS